MCIRDRFTSCSDDDDPVYPIEEEIAGTYKGTLDIELAGTPVATGMPKNLSLIHIYITIVQAVQEATADGKNGKAAKEKDASKPKRQSKPRKKAAEAKPCLLYTSKNYIRRVFIRK